MSNKPGGQSARGSRRPLILLLIGCGSLVLAFASFVVLALNDMNGYDWPSSAAVPIDGQQHTLRLPEHQTTMLWMYDATNAPTCRFREAQTSRDLPLRSSTEDYWRSGGTGGGYRGDHTFNSGSGQVTGRCTGVSDVSPVYVERAPSLPPLLDGSGVLNLVMQGLALTGLLLVALAVIFQVRRVRPRMARAPHGE